MSHKIRTFVVCIAPNINHDKLQSLVASLSYYVDNFHGINVIRGDSVSPNVEVYTKMCDLEILKLIFFF